MTTYTIKDLIKDREKLVAVAEAQGYDAKQIQDVLDTTFPKAFVHGLVNIHGRERRVVICSYLNLFMHAGPDEGFFAVIDEDNDSEDLFYVLKADITVTNVERL